MAKLISGKEVSAQIRQKIKEEAQALRENSGIQPGLAVILVGNDPDSGYGCLSFQRSMQCFFRSGCHVRCLLFSFFSGQPQDRSDIRSLPVCNP